MLEIPEVQFDERGLVPVILQHAETGEVLTLAYMNAESLARTCSTGETWLWSRSRQELWHKGATSGNTQEVVSLHPDCDRDALVVRVRPRGPACHLGSRSCFPGAAPTLLALDDTLRQRDAERPAGSWTTRLLEDENLRLKKIGEEATEVVLALATRDDEGVADEAADLVYHLLVALRGRGLGVGDVLAVLQARAS